VKRPIPAAIDPILKTIIRGEELGAFDSELGRALLRAQRAGATDGLEPLFESLLLPLYEREARGQIVPFKPPNLRRGDVVLGHDAKGAKVRIPTQSLAAGVLLAATPAPGRPTS
jgi:hypothetical protein